MNRGRWLAVVVAAQVLWLLGWAGYHEWNRATAPTILLETEPVDPRDLLRGDYLILAYRIGRVPVPDGDASTGAEIGRSIWVTLQPAGRFHTVADSAWEEPDNPPPGAVVVRGRVQRAEDDAALRVVYEIEKYFVPEGRGSPRFEEMIVEATVSPSRRLGIKRLLVDGQPYP